METEISMEWKQNVDYFEEEHKSSVILKSLPISSQQNKNADNRKDSISCERKIVMKSIDSTINRLFLLYLIH